MTLIPPKRSEKVTQRGVPTSRFAEWMERVSRDINSEGSTSRDGYVQTSDLGTAAYQDVGTSEGDVVQLDSVGLPAVDGSQLTGIPGVSAPESLTFTYNPDGTILNISGATTDIDFTYSGGLVSTVDDQTYLKTFSYNGSNQLITITVT
jgi:hypothetical protein